MLDFGGYKSLLGMMASIYEVHLRCSGILGLGLVSDYSKLATATAQWRTSHPIIRQ